MNRKFNALVLIFCFFLLFSLHLGATDTKDGVQPTDCSKVLVVWSSGDRDVALKLVFMYTYNAKRMKWFDDVMLLVWGPSAKLLSEDKELQEGIEKIKKMGIELTACKACSDMYGVSDKLKKLGIDVKYMGKALSDMLKKGWHVLTF